MRHLLRIIARAWRFRSLRIARISADITRVMERGTPYEEACQYLNEKYK